MSLDNKIPGDKMWAFEMNGIIKAIRNAVLGLLDKGGYIGQINGSAVTVPDNCNMVIINTPTSVGVPSIRADLILTRNGKTTAIIETYADGSFNRATITWSGNTINGIASTDTVTYMYS